MLKSTARWGKLKGNDSREFIIDKKLKRQIEIISIKGNSKYKLIKYEGKNYVIDLNSNKLSYIFPLLNYFTPHKLIEVSLNDINNEKSITKNEDKFNEALLSLSVGITVILGVLLRPLFDYGNFPSSRIFNLLIILLTNFALILTKFIFDKRKRDVLALKNRTNVKLAYILPNFKIVIKNTVLYLILSFLYLMSLIAFYSMENSNIFFILTMIIFLLLILFQNIRLYGKIKIYGKISEIN